MDLRAPILTVYRLLEQHEVMELLEDPLISVATSDIVAGMVDVKAAVQRKRDAVQELVERYRRSKPAGEAGEAGEAAGGIGCEQKQNSRGKEDKAEVIERAIASIADNNSFVSANRGVVEDMLGLLETYFSPDNKQDGFSLAIGCGRGRYSFSRSKMTHSHQQQWHYVHQSLSLWCAVLADFFRLWVLAENDMLSTSCRYRLRNTGQGLHRVQACPSVGAAMSSILQQVC